MAISANLGYPRFGAKRELKRALETFWSDESRADDLLDVGKQLRLAHWQLQQAAAIDVIPSNDFSFYDQVLDTSVLVGAIPSRYDGIGLRSSLKMYFAMARGIQHDHADIRAMEMTKWFDTNYHYIVPEITPQQTFRLSSTKPIDEFNEAKQAGIHTRPVLLGPVSYLLLSKSSVPDGAPLEALPALLPVYGELLAQLATAGADWVQIDEPCLVLDLAPASKAAYQTTYAYLAHTAKTRLMLTTYFGPLGDNLQLATRLPIDGLHVDLVRAPEQLETVLASLPAGKVLSLGVVDGRNVWRTDLDTALDKVQRAAMAFGATQLQIAPSCSLLYVPHDLELESNLDDELRSWLAFARQKLNELSLLKQACNAGPQTVAEGFALSRTAIASRRASPRTHNPVVQARMDLVNDTMLHRTSEYRARRSQQAEGLGLPPLPTTTIGSFPQTARLRAQRAAFNNRTLSAAEYTEFLKAEIASAVRWQEEIGLDVLVHGEFERTDMVEYFGEQLTGIAFTQHGWVQSYGSRGVRPPIIYGDVTRPAPMTIQWSAYAQSLTTRPMKGMLTGPITILEWSFVRDDQPRSQTCQQIALALRDEVLDLERAGIRIIQIDEPAFREGLPLRAAAQAEYLRWAVDAFRLASSGVKDSTQIHTHMCYAEFNDIIDSIAALDADVISIETSRSAMELLRAFAAFKYPNEIGPGVYDIHSPRIPNSEEMTALLDKALTVLAPSQVWVNPDCGLKTRRWEEVRPALINMVQAAQALRNTFAARDAAAVDGDSR